jgi:hypothetical protein
MSRESPASRRDLYHRSYVEKHMKVVRTYGVPMSPGQQYRGYLATQEHDKQHSSHFRGTNKQTLLHSYSYHDRHLPNKLPIPEPSLTLTLYSPPHSQLLPSVHHSICVYQTPSTAATKRSKPHKHPKTHTEERAQSRQCQRHKTRRENTCAKSPGMLRV